MVGCFTFRVDPDRSWRMKEEPQEYERSDEGERRKGLNWGMIAVGVIVGVALLAGFSPCLFSGSTRQRAARDRTEAINNAKQVGLALLEFEQEFGSFPGEETSEMVKKATGTELDLSGTSSNAMFRQLIAFGIQSEDIFYCKHPEGIRKPDKDIAPRKALEAGEVGFSYIYGQSTKDEELDPGRIVLEVPMKIGTDQFWEKPYGMKAVLLRLDNSVEAPLIREKDGKASVGDGRTLFDTGEGTAWGNRGPVDIRHPERGK
jgi:hypothetical protein